VVVRIWFHPTFRRWNYSRPEPVLAVKPLFCQAPVNEDQKVLDSFKSLALSYSRSNPSHSSNSSKPGILNECVIA